MANAVNFTLGSIYPSDPNRALPYGMESIQKWLPVTLDQFFLDSVTGATCSRAIRCNTSGVINLLFADGTSQQMAYLGGVVYPEKAFKVISTGTTASGIFWGY